MQLLLHTIIHFALPWQKATEIQYFVKFMNHDRFVIIWTRKGEKNEKNSKLKFNGILFSLSIYRQIYVRTRISVQCEMNIYRILTIFILKPREIIFTWPSHWKLGAHIYLDLSTICYLCCVCVWNGYCVR